MGEAREDGGVEGEGEMVDNHPTALNKPDDSIPRAEGSRELEFK